MAGDSPTFSNPMISYSRTDLKIGSIEDTDKVFGFHRTIVASNNDIGGSGMRATQRLGKRKSAALT